MPQSFQVLAWEAVTIQSISTAVPTGGASPSFLKDTS